jgi:hypothetical protein
LAGKEKTMAINEPTKETSVVEKASDATRNRVGELQEAIAMLEKRLSPVLTSRPESGPAGTVEKNPVEPCDVEKWFRRTEYEISVCLQDVHSILSRLQI